MQQILKQLNWYYYGVMVVTLIALTVMYYLFSHALYEPLDPLSTVGTVSQYIVIFMALLLIPGGLYLVKFFRPQTLERYRRLAAARILLAGSPMPFGIVLFYLLGAYRPMMWVAAIGAVAWYFTKPTLGKIEQEMTPRDPDIPTY